MRIEANVSPSIDPYDYSVPDDPHAFVGLLSRLRSLRDRTVRNAVAAFGAEVYASLAPWLKDHRGDVQMWYKSHHVRGTQEIHVIVGITQPIGRITPFLIRVANEHAQRYDWTLTFEPRARLLSEIDEQALKERGWESIESQHVSFEDVAAEQPSLL